MMEYVGQGPERGNRINEVDAFEYALERCLHGSVDDQAEFREYLLKWFYSKHWIYQCSPRNKLQTVFIVRCSDGYMSAHSSYIEAFRAGCAHIWNGVSMVIV